MRGRGSQYQGADGSHGRQLQLLRAVIGLLSTTALSFIEGYQRTTDIHQPRFSVAPVIGMDIFVFSHIAIQMEYGFRGGSWFSHDRHIHLPAHARRDICDQERPASSLFLDRIEGNLPVQVHIRRWQIVLRNVIRRSLRKRLKLNNKIIKYIT